MKALLALIGLLSINTAEAASAFLMSQRMEGMQIVCVYTLLGAPYVIQHQVPYQCPQRMEVGP